jgi:hypothetical protein
MKNISQDSYEEYKSRQLRRNNECKPRQFWRNK